MPEIQGSTQEVAYAKVQRAAEILQGPCITEDTALCFKALGGLPGPFIKFFLQKVGHEGMQTQHVELHLRLTQYTRAYRPLVPRAARMDRFTASCFCAATR